MFAQKQCLVFTCKDITKIKEHAKLAADNKLLQLISSSVSHEMLTPIKCIILMVETLARMFSDPDSTHKFELIITTA